MPTRHKQRALEHEGLAPKRAARTAPRSPDAGHVPPTGIHTLQRAIGNRAVGGLLVQRSEPEEEGLKIAHVPTAPPLVPIPYPNTAPPSGAKQATPKVAIKNKQAITGSSETSRSSGDEAGTRKGMQSKTAMSATQYNTGASKVRFEGEQASEAPTDQTLDSSPPGPLLPPSQSKVRIEDE